MINELYKINEIGRAEHLIQASLFFENGVSTCTRHQIGQGTSEANIFYHSYFLRSYESKLYSRNLKREKDNNVFSNTIQEVIHNLNAELQIDMNIEAADDGVNSHCKVKYPIAVPSNPVFMRIEYENFLIMGLI